MNRSSKSNTIALTGNPNSGKSSVFNLLTGLRQKVGNFPGVTVEKKTGALQLPAGTQINVVDLPGLYSLFPTSGDGKVVVENLCDTQQANYPDILVYIADASNLERHLLLFLQLKDLGLHMIFCLNMLDAAEHQHIRLDISTLTTQLDVPIIAINGRTGKGIDDLKIAIENMLPKVVSPSSLSYHVQENTKTVLSKIRALQNVPNDYYAVLLAQHHTWLRFLDSDMKAEIGAICKVHNYVPLKEQVEEINQRYDTIHKITQKSVSAPTAFPETFSDKIDKVLTHPVWGVLIFLVLTALVFQAVFAWASYPMDLIENVFAQFSSLLKTLLPEHWTTDLLTDGILAGLGGIIVFIPQVAILFLLLQILEDMGYMARVVYMFDNLMRRFGMNGRSLVALVSSGACAIPAIMATRTIPNWKERMITIMVAPLISCSARIPVYTVLIAFVAPPTKVWGIFNWQGIAFMVLYLLGIFMALVVGCVFKYILKSSEPSYLMIEMPRYHPPVFRNILQTVYEKVVAFVVGAGKIIIVISIILWALAGYGPSNDMQQAEQNATEYAIQHHWTEVEKSDYIAAQKLESSYAGRIGKFIEPAIAPLGFDWKIGIALITSFAAREVFVGTIATIYSIGSTDDEATIRSKMAAEVNPKTGKPTYNLAAAASLLIFYVFAMQCMSTLAVVRRETGSWKWAIIQFAYMGLLAYLFSFVVYVVLSPFT